MLTPPADVAGAVIAAALNLYVNSLELTTRSTVNDPSYSSYVTPPDS